MLGEYGVVRSLNIWDWLHNLSDLNCWLLGILGYPHPWRIHGTSPVYFTYKYMKGPIFMGSISALNREIYVAVPWILLLVNDIHKVLFF